MAWKRMIERGDEGAPPIGARMPYVILSDENGLGGKETLSKMYERSEHPEFSKKSGRRLDYPYYIESLFNPVQKLLQFCNIQDLKKIFKEAKELASNNLKNVTTLKRFMTVSSSTDHFNLSSSSSFLSSNSSTSASQDNELMKKQKSNKKVKTEDVNIPKLKQRDLSNFFK
jgi:hypothetical protein